MTVGYGILVALVCVVYLQEILNGLTFERIIHIATAAGIVYGILFLIYLIVGHFAYAFIHKKAKNDVRIYYGQLHKLSRLYKEERMMQTEFDYDEEGEIEL